MLVYYLLLVAIVFVSIIFLTAYLFSKKREAEQEKPVTDVDAAAIPLPIKKEGFLEKCKCAVRDHEKFFLSLLLVVLNIIFFYIYYWEAIPYVGEEYFSNLHISWLYFWATISIGFFTLVPYYFILADFFKPNDNLWNGYRLISCIAPFIILFFISQNPSNFFDKAGNAKVWIYEQNGEIKEVYWYNRGKSQKYGAQLRAITIGDVDELQKKVFSFDNFSFPWFASQKERVRLTLYQQGYIGKGFPFKEVGKLADITKVNCPPSMRYCVWLYKDDFTVGSPVTENYIQEIKSETTFYWIKEGTGDQIYIEFSIM